MTDSDGARPSTRVRAVVACRASLALVTLFVGVFALLRPGALRRAGIGLGLASLAYLALSWLVLRPAFAGGAATSLDALCSTLDPADSQKKTHSFVIG